jgi:hypothetical protein
MFQPRSKVHCPADHRVVHTIIAAKIADRTVSGVNADSAAQGRRDPNVGPFLRQFADALLHGDRHFNACECILLYSERRRIAKEHDNGVADIFVDRRPVLQRDFRHLGEIVVKELGEILRLQFVGDLGEPNQIRKTDRELLSLADDLDVLLTCEDRIVYLRRKVFGEL